MKILLLNPPGDVIRTGRLVRRSKIHTQSWPPIYLAYATGVLEKYGYECKLIDASVMGSSINETYNTIIKWNPDKIAYYWAYDTAETDLKFADILGTHWDVTLVGPWSAHMPNALEKCRSVNSMTFGQFEYTLPKLFDSTDKKDIPGLRYREDNKILFNPQREPYTTRELDWMPFVTGVYKKHLSIPSYHQTSFRHPFVDLFTASSCPHRCAFCSWINGMDRLHPQRYQKRSLRLVIDELWFIKECLTEVNQVFFQDSTLPTPRAVEISQTLLDEKLDIVWGCYSRADKDYETLKLMKDAGCRTMHVGYEVPDQTILNEIRKDLTVQQQSEFATNVKKLGMWTSSSFMIFPWMTEQQIKNMVSWIKKSDATRINVAQLQPYPNVPIIDVMSAYKDLPNKHMMDFDEMRKWEQYCFRQFYLYNPKWWLQTLSSPREIKHVIEDGVGMLRFLREK